MNRVIIEGILSSEPRERALPSGTVVSNWEVTTPIDGKAQSVPVQWDTVTTSIRKVSEGDQVVVVGSIRRRFFRAGGATMSRTEVLGERFAKSGSKSADKLVQAFASP